MKAMVFNFSILLYLSAIGNLMAQEDCVLGVGITKNKTIIEVFQLNEEQAEQVTNYSAELKYRNEILNNQSKNIMKRHPQSTVAELKVLAEKYNVIRDSMESIQRMIDMRTLKLFNKKQYTRYLELCGEAFRQPFRVIPMSYRDSIPQE
jgi:hypothetical protein